MSSSQSKQKIIVANWKMNPANLSDAENILKAVRKGIKKSDNASVIICPPSIYLHRIKANSDFEFGAQNIFWEDEGAYTGEISAKMVKHFGANYVIIGHSERRTYLKETDEIVNQKIKAALRGNLKPILCVGESLHDKQDDKASDVVASQLEKDLADIPENVARFSLTIAYEPVWAIGTGETPTSDEIMSVTLLIKKVLSRLYDRETAEKVPILYGGSVNSRNALDFVDKARTDGLLVGGASLNASEFARIVNLFS